MARKTQSIRHPLFLFAPSSFALDSHTAGAVLHLEPIGRAVELEPRGGGQGRPYPKTDRKGDTLPAAPSAKQSSEGLGATRSLTARSRYQSSWAESFDGFLVRDIAVADLPLTSLIAQNQAFAWCAIALRLGRRRQGIFLLPFITLSRTSRTPNDSDGHPYSPKQPSARNLFCLYLAPADWSNCRE